MIPVPFANMAGASAVAPNSQEMLLNMYADVELSGYSKLIRLQRPGLTRHATRTGTGRGVWKFGDYHYTVFDANVWRVSSAGAVTFVGTIGTINVRNVTMAWNGTQIAVCDGDDLYVWNGSTFAVVVKPDSVLRITSVDYLDGFGVLTTDGQKFFVTELNDFSTIGPFASAEGVPDPLKRVFVDHREVWLFGTTSIEVWYNNGGLDFPFLRMGNASIERGCLAEGSVAAEDNSVFWLGDDSIIYRADGYRPVRISTSYVERAMSAATPEQLQAARGWFYSWLGHKFYVFTVPDVCTFVFDVKTQWWHQAQTSGHPHWAVTGNDRGDVDHVVGDDGHVLSFADVSKDDGLTMVRSGTSPPVYANGSRIRISNYRLDIETGLATPGYVPQIMLQLSPDGKIWGNEHWRTCGAIGEYQHRAMWRNKGAHRVVHFRFRFTDDAPLKIVNAEGKFAKLDSLNG